MLPYGGASGQEGLYSYDTSWSWSSSSFVHCRFASVRHCSQVVHQEHTHSDRQSQLWSSIDSLCLVWDMVLYITILCMRFAMSGQLIRPTKRLVTSILRTSKRSLSRVYPHMLSQIGAFWKSDVTIFPSTLERLFSRMNSLVYCQTCSYCKWFAAIWIIARVWLFFCMSPFMLCKSTWLGESFFTYIANVWSITCMSL